MLTIDVDLAWCHEHLRVAFFRSSRWRSRLFRSDPTNRRALLTEPVCERDYFFFLVIVTLSVLRKGHSGRGVPRRIELVGLEVGGYFLRSFAGYGEDCLPAWRRPPPLTSREQGRPSGRGTPVFSSPFFAFFRGEVGGCRFRKSSTPLDSNFRLFSRSLTESLPSG